MAASNNKTALVLTGGGARAAYQVGVLLAVSKLSGNRRRNPFPILCGTSAGAINVTSIACLADNFGKAIVKIFPETTISDQRLEILMRCTNNTDINGDFLTPTESLYYPLLQESQ